MNATDMVEFTDDLGNGKCVRYSYLDDSAVENLRESKYKKYEHVVQETQIMKNGVKTMDSAYILCKKYSGDYPTSILPITTLKHVFTSSASYKDRICSAVNLIESRLEDDGDIVDYNLYDESEFEHPVTKLDVSDDYIHVRTISGDIYTFPTARRIARCPACKEVEIEKSDDVAKLNLDAEVRAVGDEIEKEYDRRIQKAKADSANKDSNGECYISSDAACDFGEYTVKVYRSKKKE